MWCAARRMGSGHPSFRPVAPNREVTVRSHLVRSQLLRSALAPVLAVGLALGAAACGDDEDDNGPMEPEETVFEADLSGAAEVPPVQTDASGTATFTMTNGTIDYEIRVQNLVDVVAAHIHIGSSTENGPIAVGLFASEQPQTIQDGVLVQGQFTAADVQGDFTLDGVLQSMANGGAYVNVHTTANPPGEIRGQIQLTQGSLSSTSEESPDEDSENGTGY